MSSKPLLDVWESFRYWAALSILLLILAFIPLLTLVNNSVQTNYIVAQAQLLFFVFSVKEARLGFGLVFFENKSRFAQAFLVIALSLIVISVFVSGGYERFLFYFSSVIFFISLVGFLSAKPMIFDFGLIAKLVSVLVIGFYFMFHVFHYEEVYQYIFRYPPLYNHLRHFNYDLMAAILAAIAIFYQRKYGYSLLFFSLLALGVFSMWTGGRGQLLSFFILSLLLALSGHARVASVAVFSMIIAYLMVLFSGEIEFASSQLERTLDSGDMNSISTGRWSLWKDTVEESLGGGWLGNGADAFQKFNTTFIVHPHNAIVQFLFEYGFFGLLLCIVFFAWTTVVCLKLIFTKNTDVHVKVLSAFVIAMFAYSMVDGIFYHASPFAFMIFIGAALFVKAQRSRSACESLA
ncbi:hypothetical protein KUV78_03385 [Marinobacter hydrocarbonoclasticus]|uniref:O-antigen ligase family protein n=1 Tax=Marinobacter nauticus TaxID=2743 RepID=UPI001C950D87|nr:O-antigen ligase family protein [Marinobacter nauticus]MBY6192831.1 hypothetical protein [Marinobacter nauticus]MBY6213979.1 hypothetical protein [Marinobacter nauticus]